MVRSRYYRLRYIPLDVKNYLQVPADTVQITNSPKGKREHHCHELLPRIVPEIYQKFIPKPEHEKTYSFFLKNQKENQKAKPKRAAQPKSKKRT